MNIDVYKEADWRYVRIRKLDNMIQALKKDDKPRVIAGRLDEVFPIDNVCSAFIIKHYEDEINQLKKEFDEL